MYTHADHLDFHLHEPPCCSVVATSFAAPPQLPRQDDAQRPTLSARQIEEAGRMTPEEAQEFAAILFPKLPPQSLESIKEIA